MTGGIDDLFRRDNSSLTIQEQWTPQGLLYLDQAVSSVLQSAFIVSIKHLHEYAEHSILLPIGNFIARELSRTVPFATKLGKFVVQAMPPEVAHTLPRHWPFGVPADSETESDKDSKEGDQEDPVGEVAPSRVSVRQVDIAQHAVDALHEAEQMNRRHSLFMPSRPSSAASCPTPPTFTMAFGETLPGIDGGDAAAGIRGNFSRFSGVLSSRSARQAKDGAGGGLGTGGIHRVLFSSDGVHQVKGSAGGGLGVAQGDGSEGKEIGGQADVWGARHHDLESDLKLDSVMESPA